MKNTTLLILALVGASLLAFWGMAGCTVNQPTVNPLGLGKIIVQDAATGTCPVSFWLDGQGPTALYPGNIKTITDVSYGTHNLTFTTTGSVTCGGFSNTCFFCCNQTGASTNFYMNPSSGVQTATITDNGCSTLWLNGP